MYCACGAAGNYATSPDAVAWTVWQTPTARALYSVARGDDRFVVVGDRTWVVLIDGQAPTVYTDAVVSYAVCYHAGYFWRTTNVAKKIQKSADGASWTDVTFVGLNGATISIAANDDVMIVGCGTFSGNGYYAITTDGGDNWTVGYGSLGGSIGNFAIWLVGCHGTRVYGGGLGGAGHIGYSDPPYSSWRPLLVANAKIRGTINPITDIAFSPECGIAAGGSTAINLTTDNGITWLSAPASADAAKIRHRIIYDGTRFLAGGPDGRIMQISSDGLTISQPSSVPTVPGGQNIFGIAYGESMRLYINDGAWTKVSEQHQIDGDWVKASQIFVPSSGAWAQS